MAKGKRKDVAVRAGTEVAEAPDWMDQEQQRGSEEVGIADIALPRISMIHDLSPQHKKSKSEYIEGAETGMCFNTVTNELYGTEIIVIPVYYKPEWVVWKHRDAGGGFLGAFDSPQEAADFAATRGEWGQTTDKGDDAIEVLDTGQQYCLILADSGPQEAVFSMAKSQQKPSRQLNSMVRMVGGDRFARQYRFSVVEVQNNQGQDYFNWRIDQLGFVQDQAHFKQAEAMYEAVADGRRGVAYAVDPADAE